ncbi:MAG: hypothetical protein QXQ02_06675 [Halobacteria archaeon]
MTSANYRLYPLFLPGYFQAWRNIGSETTNIYRIDYVNGIIEDVNRVSPNIFPNGYLSFQSLGYRKPETTDTIKSLLFVTSVPIRKLRFGYSNAMQEWIQYNDSKFFRYSPRTGVIKAKSIDYVEFAFDMPAPASDLYPDVYIPNVIAGFFLASTSPNVDTNINLYESSLITSNVLNIMLNNTVEVTSSTEWTTLMFINTEGTEYNKFFISNTSPTVSVDVQILHCEPFTDDWGFFAPYADFATPKTLAPDTSLVFGEDATIDTRWSYHLVRAKLTTGNTPASINVSYVGR